MKIEPDLHIRRALDAAPGELIAIELRSHRALAIVLSKETTKSLIGVIHSSESLTNPMPPFAYEIGIRNGGTKDCASYGTDWLIELLPGLESVPGNRSEWSSSGVVCLTREGPTIFFPRIEDRQWHDGYTFNLFSSELVPGADDGVPHLNWNLWNSSDEHARAKGEPLLRFVGASTQDR